MIKNCGARVGGRSFHLFGAAIVGVLGASANHQHELWQGCGRWLASREKVAYIPASAHEGRMFIWHPFLANGQGI